MTESGQLFNLKFVAEIEKHPCLYNNQLPEYSRRDKIEQAWLSVRNSVNLSVSECKKKWKNLRTVFIRHIKLVHHGSNVKMKKAYYLEEAMMFIIPFLKTQIPIIGRTISPEESSGEEELSELQEFEEDSTSLLDMPLKRSQSSHEMFIQERFSQEQSLTRQEQLYQEQQIHSESKFCTIETQESQFQSEVSFYSNTPQESQSQPESKLCRFMAQETQSQPEPESCCTEPQESPSQPESRLCISEDQESQFQPKRKSYSTANQEHQFQPESDLCSADPLESQSHSQSEQSSCSTKKRSLPEGDRTYPECSQAKRINVDASDVNDARKMFLLSLLPDINEMSGQQMRVFKRRVMALVDDILQAPLQFKHY